MRLSRRGIPSTVSSPRLRTDTTGAALPLASRAASCAASRGCLHARPCRAAAAVRAPGSEAPPRRRCRGNASSRASEVRRGSCPAEGGISRREWHEPKRVQPRFDCGHAPPRALRPCAVCATLPTPPRPSRRTDPRPDRRFQLSVPRLPPCRRCPTPRANHRRPCSASSTCYAPRQAQPDYVAFVTDALARTFRDDLYARIQGTIVHPACRQAAQPGRAHTAASSPHRGFPSRAWTA